MFFVSFFISHIISMKNYLVHLDGGRIVPVEADTYSELGGRWLFFRDDSPIPFTFFEAAIVDGISEKPASAVMGVFPPADTGYDALP